MLTLASLKKGQAKVGTYIHTWRTMKDKYMAGHGPVFWCCEHRYYYRNRIGIEIQKSKIQKYLSRRAIFSLLITSADTCSFFFYLFSIFFYLSSLFVLGLFMFNFMWFIKFRPWVSICGICAAVCGFVEWIFRIPTEDLSQRTLIHIL